MASTQAYKPAPQAHPEASVAIRWRSLLGLRAMLAIAVLPVALHVYGFRAAIIDDAFIQFQYAKLLSSEGTWGMIHDRIANTSTSPLNVLAYAILAFLPGSIKDASLWLTALEMLASLAILLKISTRCFNSYAFGIAAFIAIAFNPLLLSSIGLESLLFVTILLAVLLAHLENRPVLVGLLLGLLILTRPDGAILALIIIVATGSNRARLQTIASMCLAIAPWALYSWIHLGSLFPDTLLIKVWQPAWSHHSFFNGLSLYWKAYPLAILASFALVPFAMYAVLRQRDSGPSRTLVRLLSLYVLIHFLGYSALFVPPYHWYYVQEAIPLAILAAVGIQDLMRRPSVMVRKLAYGACALTPLLFVVLAVDSGWPLREAPIHTNWATSPRYETVGQWLRDNVDPADTILLSGEIGTLAYYSDRALVNEFSDLNWTTNTASARGLVSGKLIAISQAWRRTLPPLECPKYLIEQRDSPPHDPAGLGPRYGGQLIQQWTTATSWTPERHIYLWRIPNDALATYKGGCYVEETS